MDFITVKNGEISLNVAVKGEGPLIVCVHGWPELWYSWRWQMDHFAALGFKVAALDVRGYGGSSKPPEVAAYSLCQLASDVIAVVDHFGAAPAILFGHDWGAPIVWNTTLLYPEKIRAVAGLSVPYMPRGEMSFIELAKILYKDRFFYQLYFQKEGPPEAEFEADIPAALRKIYYSASGDSPRDGLMMDKGPDSTMLDGMPDPDPFPAWMSPADLKVYVDAFTAGGFRGPFNRYRAQNIDFAELAAYAGAKIAQPTFFVAGERDPVRNFVGGMDLYANAGAALEDFRGAVIIPGVGHWVQQEAPDAVNLALEGFVEGLSRSG
jgi:pimeloyl-ACP methyl ester carboxylesterase